MLEILGKALVSPLRFGPPGGFYNHLSTVSLHQSITSQVSYLSPGSVDSFAQKLWLPISACLGGSSFLCVFPLFQIQE